MRTSRLAGAPAAKTLVIHPTVMVPFGSINLMAYNPRKWTAQEMGDLKASMRRYGFLDPLALRKKNSGCLGGHMRVSAVREVCTEDSIPMPKSLPAVVLDVTEREGKMLNIALNKLGGRFDNKKLAELLAGIQGEQTIAPDERDLMGFHGTDLTDLLALNEPPRVDTDPKAFAKGPSISLIFSSAKVRDATRETLHKRAEAENVHPGDIVFRLLGGDPMSVN